MSVNNDDPHVGQRELFSINKQGNFVQENISPVHHRQENDYVKRCCKLFVWNLVISEATKESLRYKVFHEIFLSSSMPIEQKYLYNEGFKKKNPFYFSLLCVDVVLRGIAQVFLCNHPLCGVMICVGIGLTSYKLPLYALLGTAVSTFSAATIARPPEEDLMAGLCGYDGALVGCSCLTFLASKYSIGSTILLSFLAGVVHVACANLMKIWQLPTFTFAFNIVTIMILFAVKYNVVGIEFSTAPPAKHADNFTDMSLNFAVDATIRGVGQFMFADTTVGSAFVIAGIAMCSRKGAAVAMVGSIVGWVIAFYVLDVSNKVNVRTGLYGYNCAGTCCVLAGGIFYKASDGAVLVGVLGAALASLLTVGLQGAFGGLPVLTFPFILSAWIIMLSRSKWLNETSDGIIRPLMRRMSSRQLSTGRTFKIPLLDFNPGERQTSSKNNRYNLLRGLSNMSNKNISLETNELDNDTNGKHGSVKLDVRGLNLRDIEEASNESASDKISPRLSHGSKDSGGSRSSRAKRSPRVHVSDERDDEIVEEMGLLRERRSFSISAKIPSILEEYVEDIES